MTLTDAVQQLRDELRLAVLDANGEDILFTPEKIEIELAVTFATEVKAGGGVKLLTFLDFSSEAKGSKSQGHKIKINLGIADRDGNPLKIASKRLPRGV